MTNIIQHRMDRTKIPSNILCDDFADATKWGARRRRFAFTGAAQLDPTCSNCS